MRMESTSVELRHGLEETVENGASLLVQKV